MHPAVLTAVPATPSNRSSIERKWSIIACLDALPIAQGEIPSVQMIGSSRDAASALTRSRETIRWRRSRSAVMSGWHTRGHTRRQKPEFLGPLTTAEHFHLTQPSILPLHTRTCIALQSRWRASERPARPGADRNKNDSPRCATAAARARSEAAAPIKIER